MIYGYVRVSTDKQTVENQRFEIMRFAEEKGIKIDRWIEETISGTVDPEKRLLGRLIVHMKKDDVLVCSELSRLGRNMFMIMTVLNEMLRRNIKIMTVKEKYELGDDILSKVLAFSFSISAEIERTLLSQRTTESLRRLKAEGKQLGRPKGRCNDSYKLTGLEKEIINMKKSGKTVHQICEYFDVSTGTLYSHLKREGIYDSIW